MSIKTQSRLESWGGTPENGLYGEAPLLTLSIVEVYKRVEKTVIFFGKKAQKGLTDALHGCEKSRGLNGLVL